MKAEVRVLCRPGTAAGFALAGLRPVEAEDPAASAQRLLELLGEENVGVVLIEDSLHHLLPPELRRQLARRPAPMIVPFPTATWTAPPAGADGYIAELLRQAIGYRVRLL